MHLEISWAIDLFDQVTNCLLFLTGRFAQLHAQTSLLFKKANACRVQDFTSKYSLDPNYSLAEESKQKCFENKSLPKQQNDTCNSSPPQRDEMYLELT